MSYVNNFKPYTPSKVVPELDDPIDINFCLPIPGELNSERVKLVPFVPSQHAGQLLAAVSDNPSLYRYFQYGPFYSNDPDSFYEWYEDDIRSNPSVLLFAIIDKTKPSPSSHPNQGGPMAGILGYINTSPPHFATELGHVMIFPPWQRTFVTTNAIALAIIHALDDPVNGGWGFRRVQWLASTLNTRSIKAAERMGMKQEGVIKWQINTPTKDEQGRVVEGEVTRASKDRHSALLAVCWDDWDKSTLEGLIARRK